MTALCKNRIAFSINHRNFPKMVKLVKLPVLTRKFDRSSGSFPAGRLPVRRWPNCLRSAAFSTKKGLILIGMSPGVIQIAL
jgi:hypothetical protein